MSQINVSAVYDAYGSNNAILYGVASPPSSMGFRNRIINGDMRIDQRNNGVAATISGTTTFVLDRWLPQRNGSLNNYTAQRVSIAPPGHSFSQQFTMGTGVTPGVGDYAYLLQAIEGFNISDLAWGTTSALAVTVSFWVRSSLTGVFGGSVRNSAGTQSYVFSFPINAANTFEYKTVTIPGATTGTWNTDNTTGITLNFDLGVGQLYSTTAGSWQGGNFFGLVGGVKLAANTGATLNITGIQFEQGVVATAFERRDYGRELMMCQRYYWQGSVSIGPEYENSAGSIPAATRISFPVTMRAIPVIAFPTNISAALSNTPQSTFISTSGFSYQINVTATGTYSREDISTASTEIS
jgi:hypothetical protein